MCPSNLIKNYAVSHPEDHFLANWKLVYKIAYSFVRKHESASISLDDFVSVGFMGLLDALRKYDREKHVCFGSWASLIIRQHIINAIRANKSDRYVSIEIPIRKTEDQHLLIDILEDDIPSSDDRYALKEKIRELHKLIDSLPDLERKVIRLFYGIKCDQVSLKDIASLLNISTARTFRLKMSALKRLTARSKDFFC